MNGFIQLIGNENYLGKHSQSKNINKYLIKHFSLKEIEGN